MVARRSPYQRAKNEAHAMQMRDQRNARCLLGGEHDPHVFRSAGRDNPCGGGQISVDKDGDRGTWDRPGR